MSERQKILTRIREALKITSPRPGSHGFGHHMSSTLKPEAPATARDAGRSAREWLPPVGDSSAEWMSQFARNCFELKTNLIVAGDATAAHHQLRGLSTDEGWHRVATHGNAIASFAAEAIDLPVLTTDGGYEVSQLESCDAGISECDALVAQTGSVLLTSRSGGGRALSVLPPHHVVIARLDQLVPDLPAAFELLHHAYGPARWPSMMTFITGPSRTGDIERILVLGAHGPRKLTIIIY